MKALKTFWNLLRNAASEWIEDDAFTQAAALAYYTAFSLAPLLLIAIGVAGLVMGREAVQQAVLDQMSGLTGEQAGGLVSTMLEAGSKPKASIVATAIGVGVLLFGASAVFRQLQLSLNRMWEVQPKPTNFRGMIKSRFFSFGMVLGVGFLLLASMLVSATLATFGKWMSGLVPGLQAVMVLVNLAVSLAVITALFALLFKYVPLARVRWSDVWPGAFFTAALFTLGKFLIGLYIGKAGVGSEFGAAGSLAIILIWIYYSALICFFGAEFTQVYANRLGGHIEPSPLAEPLKGAPHPARDAG